MGRFTDIVPYPLTDTPRWVSGVVLLKPDGSALMQHRDNKPGLSLAGQWVFPGGHGDPGENVETCARREFFEETAYRLGEIRPLISFLDDHVAGLTPYRLNIFWALYDGVQQPLCLEGQAIEFLIRTEAARYPIPEYMLDVWDLALERQREQQHAAP